ncbi:hypothetical protein E2C01_077018 [Portunus trituberculatus]|uniref:Uncharacterized protein n=1 Tax=Portunus trituberculatus TaxID=210409 RepID=A0A5B7IKA7_PORTR|nr:hypothetical protein [Portunus trituberculatus]
MVSLGEQLQCRAEPPRRVTGRADEAVGAITIAWSGIIVEPLYWSLHGFFHLYIFLDPRKSYAFSSPHFLPHSSLTLPSLPHSSPPLYLPHTSSILLLFLTPISLLPHASLMPPLLFPYSSLTLPRPPHSPLTRSPLPHFFLIPLPLHLPHSSLTPSSFLLAHLNPSSLLASLAPPFTLSSPLSLTPPRLPCSSTPPSLPHTSLTPSQMNVSRRYSNGLPRITRRQAAELNSRSPK